MSCSNLRGALEWALMVGLVFGAGALAQAQDEAREAWNQNARSRADTLDKEFGMRFQTGVSDDVRNQLKDSGYAVKSKRQYARLWLENGRPMILPVEDTNIVPVSNKAL